MRLAWLGSASAILKRIARTRHMPDETTSPNSSATGTESAAATAPVAAAADAASGNPALDASPAAAAPEPPIAAETAPAQPAESAASLLSAETPPPAGTGGTEQATQEAAPETKAEEPFAYAEFKFPEGMKPEAEPLGKFTELLSAHRLPQDAAQGLIDLYAAEAQRMTEALTQRQFDVFAETQAQWIKDFEADPDIGRNRRETTLGDAMWLIREFGGDADQVKELRTTLGFTGAGNHRAVIRLLSNAARALRERRAPMPSNANAGRVGNPADRRYGNMGNR